MGRTPGAGPDPPTPDEFEPNDEDDLSYLDEAPPKLRRLPLAHFFRGLVVRIGRDFKDANGRQAFTGDVLKLVSYGLTNERHELAFEDGESIVVSDPSIADNTVNAWFQPVPTPRCLRSLLASIEAGMDAAAPEALRHDLDECGKWLSQPPPRGKPPRAPKRRARRHNLRARPQTRGMDSAAIRFGSSG